MGSERQPDSSQRAVSISKVAKHAGVSIATVSRVINTPDVVAPATRARVRQVIEDLSYRPNRFAKSLVTRRSGILGIALPDLHGDFYSALMRSADQRARELGHHLLVSAADRDSWATTTAFEIVDGMIVMVTERDNAAVAQLARAPSASVVIGVDARTSGLDSITIDQAAGTREAVAHLLAGVARDRVHFVGGHKGNLDSDDRCAAFVESMRQHGAEVGGGQLAHGEFSFEWGWRWATDMIQSGQIGAGRKGIGVLAANDEIAAGIFDALQDEALSIPHDVRIVGFDNSRLSQLVRPAMSSVSVPIAEAGSAAVELLIDRLATPDRPAQLRRLSTSLVIRGSSVESP